MNPICLLFLYWNLTSPPNLILINRQINQEGGSWQITYKLKYCGSESIELASSDMDFQYEAWVANSSSPKHSIPIKSELRFSLVEINSGQSKLINNSNDHQRCRERVSISFSTNPEQENKPFKGRMYWIPLKLVPQQEFWCYINLDHEHFLYGNYDPLLGERSIKVRFGGIYFLDKIPLDYNNYFIQPKIRLSEIPKERRDSRQFRSAPDSLLLAADVPGYQYFRFDDIPIKYGTELKLSFYYLVAHGTEGFCHARVMEYQDTPNAWYRLDGGFDEQLTSQGRWRKFEQIFRLRNETTTIAIDFRIIGADIGEMWIDDVILEPIEKAPQDN